MKFLPITVTVLTALLFAATTHAAGKKKNSAPAQDINNRITSVHLTSITINVYATHSAKEYKVTSATKITVNGQPTQLSGLATGMDVVVTPAADGVTAAIIDAKTVPH